MRPGKVRIAIASPLSRERRGNLDIARRTDQGGGVHRAVTHLVNGREEKNP